MFFLPWSPLRMEVISMDLIWAVSEFLASARSSLETISGDGFDENGGFDIAKCDLIAYSNGYYYQLGKKIGKFGFSVQKKRKKRKNHWQQMKKMVQYSSV